MIKLTNEDGSDVYVNPDHIVSVMMSTKGYTAIKISTQQHFYVMETAAVIAEMCKKEKEVKK